MKNIISAIMQKLASIYRAARGGRVMRPSNRFRSYIKFYRNLRVVGISALAALAAFMTLAAYPIVRVAQTAEALTGNPASTILTITSASPSANVDLVPHSSNGTFSSSSDTESAKFSILTDNYTGYKLLIAGSDNTGLLTNTDTTITTNNTLSSITTAIDAGVFGGDSATAFNGKWGYQPSKYYNPTSHTVVDNTNFLPSPTLDAPDTLDETTIANTKKPTATSDTLDCANYDCNEYTIALGARADYNVVPGTYTNTFVLTAIANKIPFTINFNDNTGDSTVANLPTTISDPTGITETSVALPQTIPTRTGYSFAGWCDTVTTINSNGSTTCTNPTTGQTGIVYPASTATTTSYLDFIDQTASSNIANLYAMWTIESYTITITNSNTTSDASSLTIPFNGSATVTVTPSSGYYLSDVSCPTGYTCTGYNTGSSYTEQQTVTIANNGTAAGGTLGFTGTLSCTPQSGTMQNFTPNTGSNYCESGTLTDNRDNQTYMVAKLADGNWWMINNLNLTAPTVDLTSSNTNLSTTVSKSTFTGWKKTSGSATYTAGEFIPLSGTDSTSGTAYGTLYNYCAASAGTICTSSNSSDATYDICPKGWRLPTGGSSGEFQNLYNQSAYNSNANMRKSYTQGGAAFALAGSFYNAAPVAQGSVSLYWSSTRFSSTDMYNLYLDTSDVNPADGGYRRYGFSIRCILDLTPYEKLQAGALSMQDIGNLTASEKTTLLSQMGTNYYTVSDNRDGQSYVIQKLADGNLWMMTNLNLGAVALSTDLTSSNTNLSTIITAADFNSYKKTSSSATYTTAEYIPVSGTDSTSQTPYGTLYNYCAASAGTICTDSNSSNATYDICPKGWRLPTGGYSEEFQALYNNSSYNSYAKMRAPISQGGAAFALAGYFTNDAPTDQGSSGGYWSSTLLNSPDMRYLRLTTSNVNPAGSSGRRYGQSIRCILETRTPYGKLQAGVLSMQDIGNLSAPDTSTLISQMSQGTQYNTTDSRDGQTYTITKINNQMWMTKNLNLAGGTALYSDTSNVPDDYPSSGNNPYYTLPASSTSGFSDDSTDYVYNSGRTNCSTSPGCYSYYSYAAATAGTNPSSGEATSDICPKGWRLPTEAEYSTLISSYNTGAKLTASPFLAVYAGRYYGSSFGSGGSLSYYWSSTASYGSSLAYSMNFNSSNAVTSASTKRYGFSVRCVKS